MKKNSFILNKFLMHATNKQFSDNSKTVEIIQNGGFIAIFCILRQ